MAMQNQSDMNKKIVREFYDLAFNKRNPKDAAAMYLGKTYRQHNPMGGDGPQAFVDAIGNWIATMPKMKVEFKRFIADGDLVAVHSHLIPEPGARGSAVMDIFRVENGRLVEHWDAMQEVPEKAANRNTMF